METDAIEAAEQAPKQGYTIVRAGESSLVEQAHRPPKPRHPAVERGLALMNDGTGGAALHRIFSAPDLDVSYAWFKSGFPLPLHSHDVDCLYVIIAGGFRLGTEELGKGDSIFIPADVPYTVTPWPEGVEFIEIRTSPDHSSNHRAKTDAYWDRVCETRKERQPIWAREAAPYRLIPTNIDPV